MSIFLNNPAASALAVAGTALSYVLFFMPVSFISDFWPNFVAFDDFLKIQTYDIKQEPEATKDQIKSIFSQMINKCKRNMVWSHLFA